MPQPAATVSGNHRIAIDLEEQVKGLESFQSVVKQRSGL